MITSAIKATVATPMPIKILLIDESSFGPKIINFILIKKQSK